MFARLFFGFAAMSQMHTENRIGKCSTLNLLQMKGRILSTSCGPIRKTKMELAGNKTPIACLVNHKK